MKRLLWVNSILFLMLSCHSTKNNIKPDNQTESVTLDGSNSQDTISSPDGSNIIGLNNGLSKDSVFKAKITNDSVQVIIHNSPDQEKIDSIKSEKLKNKK